MVAATGHLLDKPLCPSCHWWQPRDVLLAGVRTASLSCTQGCPRANTAEKWNCPRYQREPGADDDLDSADVHQPG